MKLWLFSCFCKVSFTWRFLTLQRGHHFTRSGPSNLKAWNDQEAEEEASRFLEFTSSESINSFIESTVYQRARHLTDDILRRDHKLEYFWFVDYIKTFKEDFPPIMDVPNVEDNDLNRLILFLARQPIQQVELLQEYQQVIFKAPVSPTKVAAILLTSKEFALQEIKEWIPWLASYETIFSEYIQAGRIESDQIASATLERKLKNIPRVTSSLDSMITQTALQMIEQELIQRGEPEMWSYLMKILEEEERSNILDDLLSIQQDAPRAFTQNNQRYNRNTLPGMQQRLRSKTQQILYTLHLRQLKLEEEEQFTIGNTRTNTATSASSTINRAFRPRFTRSQPLLEEIDKLIRPIDIMSSQLQSEDPLPLFTQSVARTSSGNVGDFGSLIRQLEDDDNDEEETLPNEKKMLPQQEEEEEEEEDDDDDDDDIEVEAMYQRLLQQQQLDPMLEDPFDRPSPPPPPVPPASPINSNSGRKKAVNGTEINLIHHEAFHTALTTAKSLGTLLITKRNLLLSKIQLILQDLTVVYDTEEQGISELINEQIAKNAQAAALSANPITSPGVRVKVVKGPLIIKSPAFVLGREYDLIVNTFLQNNRDDLIVTTADRKEEPLYFLVDSTDNNDDAEDPNQLPMSSTRPGSVPLSDLPLKGGEVTGSVTSRTTGPQDWNQFRSSHSNDDDASSRDDDDDDDDSKQTAEQMERKKSNVAVLDRPNDYDLSSLVPPRNTDNDNDNDKNIESGEDNPDPLDIPHGDINDFLSLPPPISITVITTKVDPDDNKRYLLLQARSGIMGTRQRVMAPYRRWIEYSQARELLMGITEEEMEQQQQQQQQQANFDSDNNNDDSSGDDNPFFGGSVPLL